MLQIRTMRSQDIPFAIRLSDQEGWGVTREDLTRILQLDPTRSLIAAEGAKRLGLSTTTTYGRKLAWIGNVIVDRRYRGKSIGSSLVQSAVERLQSLGTQHIGLYCFGENVRFYRRLGFVRDVPFVRLQRNPRPFHFTPLAPNPPRTLPLRAVVEADEKAFGADRSRLIRTVLRTKAGWYLGFSNAPSGASYLLVKEYKEMREIGPWICIRPARAQPSEMLHLAIAKTAAKPIEVSCFRNHQAVGLLRKTGFRVVRHGYRMYFDKIPRIGRPEASYALGFLDKG
jgi:predicted N-acetyltransferase YhbS